MQLYEQCHLGIKGCITGFDEYLSFILDDIKEVHIKNKIKKTVSNGILAKRDNITLIQ